MSSAVYPLCPERRWRYVEHRTTRDMLSGILVFLRLSPRKEQWFLRQIGERIRRMPLEDAVYVTLRELEYSDRTARLAILTGRRTDAGDRRRDRVVRAARQRL